jgi:hypothetical protein
LSQAQADDLEPWCTAALLAASSMSVSNDSMLLSWTGDMVYLCNLDPRLCKLKVSGPGWDDNWQEVAQGTLSIIST